MARISGVDIPREKRLEISLTYIFGIGRTTAQQICAATDIDPNTRVRDLTDEEVSRIRAYIDQNLKVEGDLRREVSQDIKRKMEIGCYQGLRHRKGLPVRGQRTHTNARTRKGPEEDRRRQEEGGTVMAKPSPEAVGPAARSARTSPTASRTSRARSTTRSSRSPTRTATSSPGPRPATSASRARARARPFAAQMAAEQCARRAMEHGVRKVDVMVKGPGSGRETAIRSIQNAGIEVTGIKDVTPVPHNGCRPPKRRRV